MTIRSHLRPAYFAVPLVLATVAIAGCANFNSIFRKTDTKEGKAETILIDAKQRPITVNRVTTPNQPITCIGRSADALSQAAASGNLKIDQSNGGGGEAGFAIAEQVSSIAFRTQVTEAQQEFLYYLCQFHANGALGTDDVSDNLRHFQNTMLAMVAIDDLSGAAKAASPANGQQTGNATPPAKPDPSDPKVQAVEQAKTGVTDKQNAVKDQATKVDAAAKAVDAVTDAKKIKGAAGTLASELTKYDKAQKDYATALATLNSNVQALKGKDAKAPDAVTSGSSTATKDQKTVASDYKTLTSDNTALGKITDSGKLAAQQKTVDTDLATYRTDVATYQSSENDLGSALVAWNDAADDSASKSANNNKGNASSGAVSDAVANDVAIIVQTIVWQSFVTEQCQKALFTKYGATDERVRSFCLKHMERVDDVREKQLLSQMSSGRAGPVPPPAIPVQSFVDSLFERFEAAAREQNAQMQAVPAPK